MLTWPKKDPNEVLDYQLDWADEDSPRLEEGESFAPSGLTTVWLSGGTAGEKCVILNRVTTSEGRTYDQSVNLRIRDK